MRTSTIHLINPMRRYSGAELRTLELYRILEPFARVRIWSGQEIDPKLAARVPISRLCPSRLHFPVRGTFVVVGSYFDPGSWIRFTSPKRLVMVYNCGSAKRLRQRIRRLSRDGSRPVELVYASPALAERIGVAGTVQISPIDLADFAPAPPKRAFPRPFTIGRLSQDLPRKHREADWELYNRLAAAGFRVRIMGGTVLRSTALSAEVEILPEGAEPASDFLRSLDCFYYRTDPDFFEPHGRVVTEAMSCQLPVVCHRNGGYADYLVHDAENGFLFDTPDHAFEIITKLRAHPELSQQIGRAARATAQSLLGPAAVEAIRSFYLES